MHHSYEHHPYPYGPVSQGNQAKDKNDRRRHD